MFNSDAYGEKNLLFKDATSELVPIATQTYEAWLGREYLHAMKGLICDPNRKYPLNLIEDWRKTLWQGNTLSPGNLPPCLLGPKLSPLVMFLSLHWPLALSPMGF